MNVVLFDFPQIRLALYPLSLTRSIADLRIGVMTIAEKWRHELHRFFPDSHFQICTAPYLQPLYGDISFAEDTLWIASHLLPNGALVETVAQLQFQEMITHHTREILAFRGKGIDLHRIYAGARIDELLSHFQEKTFTHSLDHIEHITDLFTQNAQEIKRDWQRLFSTETDSLRQGEWIQSSIIGAHPVFTGKGSRVLASIINTENGPVYIDEDVLVMEGSTIRGPVVIGKGAVIKMGARIYGATTIGPYCTIGGEVKNSVLMGYSNKAHEGYLGDSVIGEWCNLGANTNSSNIKNNAGPIRIWSQIVQAYIPAGEKCGVIMGDFSRCGIGTMLNTGTVVGVSCNIFGGDFPPKHIPSFSWGGASRWMRYELSKALHDADAWMQLKNKSLSHIQRQILTYLHQHEHSSIQSTVA
ncbi:MAG: glucose-1-phosphate thymidylyltransferase [Thermoflavifilum sp.]|nr:glucose-1-phosphate thymidylyltransferase [Thermoflavifilum sp.]